MILYFFIDLKKAFNLANPNILFLKLNKNLIDEIFFDNQNFYLVARRWDDKDIIINTIMINKAIIINT